MDKDYIRNLKIEDANQRIVDQEYDEIVRKRKVLGDITTPVVVEELNPYRNREQVMTFLKNVTYEPNKFFAYLYDHGEVEIFAERIPEFSRYIEKYRTNISAEQLITEWMRFITLTIDRALEIKGVPKRDIEAYDSLIAQQAKERTIIRKQGVDINKIKELEELERKIKEINRKFILESMEGKTESWKALDKEQKQLMKKRDALAKKIELETARSRFNPEQGTISSIERGIDVLSKFGKSESQRQKFDRLKNIYEINKRIREIDRQILNLTPNIGNEGIYEYIVELNEEKNGLDQLLGNII